MPARKYINWYKNCQHGHFLFLYVAFSGRNFIDLQLAIRLGTPSLFGIFAIASLMLFTGIDRLIAVTMPIFYKTLHQGLFIGTITLICSTFSISLIIIQHRMAHLNPHVQVTGVMGDLIQGDGGQFYVQVSLALNAVTILVYIIVWALIRVKCLGNSCARDYEISRKIFRTLLTLVSINMGGYLLIFAYYAIISPRILHFGIPVWFIEQFFGVLVNISASSQAPILYFTSTDYRKAYRAEFERLAKLWHKTVGRKSSSAVQPNAAPLNLHIQMS